MKSLLQLALLLALAPGLRADGVVSTYAGARVVDQIPALSSVLGNPTGMAVDGVGNIYLSDTGNNRIRRIDGGSGLIETIAGTGIAGFAGDDGPALLAQLNGPTQIALVIGSGFGASSYLYVADTQNQRIRRVNLSTGIIDTLAGNGVAGFAGDGGPGIYASFNLPSGLAYDANLGCLNICDTQNSCVRQLNLGSSMVSTVAGMNGSPGYNGDGLATASKLSSPGGCYFGPSDTFYFADTGNGRVRSLDGGGNIVTVAGNGSFGSSGDGGPALAASMRSPSAVFVDAAENLYIADEGSNVVREVFSASQNITTVAGDGLRGYAGDGGQALQAELGQVLFACSDVLGNLFILDGNNALRKVDGGGVISTIGGNGRQEGVDANLVQLTLPIGIGAALNGDLLVSDTKANRVRRVSASTHVVTTFAGSGAAATSGDGGQAALAGLPSPAFIATGADGTVYVAEPLAAVVRSIDNSGKITRVAGTGSLSYSGNGGQATSAGMGLPYGVCVSGNNLYVSEVNSQVIRRIDLGSGVISLYAGTPNSGGMLNGAALSAKFNGPYSIAADSSGNLYVADAANNMVRKISAGVSPTVSTLCGLGAAQGGLKGDGGPAAEAALNFPMGVYVDAQDNVFICDASNNRVRRIDARSGVIDTVAGQGLQGYAGDGGPALSASFNFPTGARLDAQGSLFVVDYQNNVVRKVSYPQTPIPTPVVSAPNKVAAYPSPASDRICFSYQAPQSGKVLIDVYNSALHLVAKIEDNVAAGDAVTCGSVKGLASGVYIYRVTAPGAAITPNKFKVAR